MYLIVELAVSFIRKYIRNGIMLFTFAHTGLTLHVYCFYRFLVMKSLFDSLWINGQKQSKVYYTNRTTEQVS
jgi:hypothetical protein